MFVKHKEEESKNKAKLTHPTSHRTDEKKSIGMVIPRKE